MQLAIASGKGGTGKTLVAVNLAAVAEGPLLVDLDVEEPNAYHFLATSKTRKRNWVYRPVPRVNEEACTHCGLCAQVCAFNAMAVLPEKVLVFEELCHACGACYHLCPEKAMREIKRPIGQIHYSAGPPFPLLWGKLRVGEAMSVPLIRAVKSRLEETRPKAVILDCPPGTACPMVESVSDADMVLLVAEPTPFGLHDLRLTVEVLQTLGKPMTVVLNREGLGPDDPVTPFCRSEGIEVLARIPHRRAIAEAYSRGETLREPELKRVFSDLRASLLPGATA